MDEFVASLGTAYWWLSVVLVGIAINLVSAYLKRPIDSAMSRVSAVSERAQHLLLCRAYDEIACLAACPIETALTRDAAHVLALRGLVEVLCGIVFFIFATIFGTVPSGSSSSAAHLWFNISLALGGLATILGLTAISAAKSELRLVRLATRMTYQVGPPNVWRR
ncbi:hypothetical protein [Ideonella sp.]|uniref:hypothetical protein n=1 Tax=Ideonella sp. TaxID=1929293 RepID=UPI0035B1995D